MMETQLVFGWRTAVLSIIFIQLILLAGALTHPLRNRVANQTLAGLLIVLAGMITPWMIGFAGFYDQWRWLSFAPFAISLAIAPLTFLYVTALTTGSWPRSGWAHLTPAGLQFAYLTGAFLLLRQPFKNDWLAQSALAYDLITGLGVIAGMSSYGIASRQLILRYRNRLKSERSDGHRFALAWLERIISALFLLLAIWVGYSVGDLVWSLGYRGLMGLYVAIGAFALFLGIEGWRHAATIFPTIAELEPAAPSTPEWSLKAADWADRVRRDRLYTEPELSVPRLAKLLGTNSAYVSRAFNEGLGQSFSTFINQLRCEDVAEKLRAESEDDLLDLALDSGFSSKASFNRAFLATFGCSPSTYRRGNGSVSK